MATKKIKVGALETTVEDLCFPVSIVDEEMDCNKEYSKRVIGVINGKEKLLNQCSNIYELVENERIFPNIEQVLFNNAIDFDVTYKHINDVRFYADYNITDSRFAYKMDGTNDTINPMIRVQHSYNGLTKYAIVFGYFRLVCTNGLTIPVEEMNEFNLSIKGKHTEIILKSLEMLNDKLNFFVHNAESITSKITAKYEKLASNVRGDVSGRIEEVLEAAKITAVDNAKFNTVEDILKRIEAEANMENLGYNGKVNDFLIYNGINQYLNDDSRNIQVPEKRMESDSLVLEYMLSN
jgi:Txe/YoeB family toxin of Txe-Axe toxin-antitoxin module